MAYDINLEYRLPLRSIDPYFTFAAQRRYQCIDAYAIGHQYHDSILIPGRSPIQVWAALVAA